MNKKILLLIIVLLAAGGALLLKKNGPGETKDLAWRTFASYRTALENHDINTVRALSYQLSPACENQASSTDCFLIMDRVASSTAAFKESDFAHVAYDRKQIVLTSDWKEVGSDIAIGKERKEIFFLRDATGAPKVLFVTQPDDIVWSFIDPKETKAALLSRIDERLTDSDGDFATDEVETCTYAGAASTTPPCVKTDPHNKDTNGNGLWDGVELYIRK